MEYGSEIAKRICEQLMEGRSLTKVCQDEGMPSRSAVQQWMRDRDDFRAAYAQAKEIGIGFHIDEIIELADSANAENAHAVRLKVDTRKWLASKLAPKLYGDRLGLDLQGEIKVSELAKPLAELTAADQFEKVKRAIFWLLLVDQEVRHPGCDRMTADYFRKSMVSLAHRTLAAQPREREVPALEQR